MKTLGAISGNVTGKYTTSIRFISKTEHALKRGINTRRECVGKKGLSLNSIRNKLAQMVGFQ